MMNRIKELDQQIIIVRKNLHRLTNQFKNKQISLDNYKLKKALLENELNGLLRKKRKIQENQSPKFDVTPTLNINTDNIEFNEKQIKIAEQAKELYETFKISFKDTISEAIIYLSEDLGEHFFIEIDFSNYPKRPILKFPPEIIDLFQNNLDDLYNNIPSYINWESEEAKHISTIISEVKVLILAKKKDDLIGDSKTPEISISEKYLTRLFVFYNSLILVAIIGAFMLTLLGISLILLFIVGGVLHIYFYYEETFNAPIFSIEKDNLIDETVEKN